MYTEATKVSASPYSVGIEPPVVLYDTVAL